ncbi:MAG: hypothetical protein OHK0040_07820 [bacterium]
MPVPTFAEDIKDEIISLTKEINIFEKNVPFFTKSKITIFLKCDTTSFYNTFYGVYINDNLVKTGMIQKEKFPLKKEVLIGDYPVYGGKNIVKLRIYNGSIDTQKKFEIDVPEYRRVAIQLYLTENPEKLKVITQAWVIE